MFTLATQTPATSGRPRLRGKIYIRVSSTRGRDKDKIVSPDVQEMLGRQKAEQENIEVLGVVYDIDETGRKFDNRKIKALIEEVRRGELDAVILYKWNRFGRNYIQSHLHLIDLEEAGGIAVSATEPGDSKTTMGKFTRAQLLLIAELQSDMISDAWKETHQLRLERGLPHYGRNVFGYYRDEKGNYHPDPVTAPALAEVYLRYVEGETFRTIALDMYDQGIRNQKGGMIWIGEWLKVMDTGFAAGLIRRKKPGTGNSRRFDQWEWYPGAHKKIISDELWEAFYNKRMASLGKNWASTKAKYSLSGLLVCFRCGRKLGATTSRGYRVYRCPGMRAGECRGVQMSLRRAEKAVLQWITARARGLESVEETARIEAARTKLVNEADEIRKKIEDIDKRLSRLLDLYENGQLDMDVYVKRKSEREMEKAELNKRLNELGASFPENRPIPSSFFTDLESAWEVISNDDKRNLLRKVIDRVIVYELGHEGGRFEIIPKYTV